MSTSETKNRSPLNSVKIQVRENALEMREFSVDEMVEATGCKRVSVQSEISRMVTDGYLTTGRSAGPHARRGKPASVYRLVNDEQKLRSLIQEVRTFRPARKPELRPRSRNYELAREFLDRAEISASEAEKKVLLNQAENLLQVAWADEGETGTVKDAFLQYEHGRLASLNNEYDRADVLLKRAAETFSKSREFDLEATNVMHHLFDNKIARVLDFPATLDRSVHTRLPRIRAREIPISPYASPAIRVQRLATAIRGDKLGSGSAPFQNHLVRTLDALADLMSSRKQVVGTAWDCLSAESNSEMPLKHESWSRDVYLAHRCIGFEPQTGVLARAVRSGRARVNRLRSLYNQQIELAVRGPIYSPKLRSVTMMSKPSRSGDQALSVEKEVFEKW